jgi:RNA polymerase sigma factor (sigma-70 family)
LSGKFIQEILQESGSSAIDTPMTFTSSKDSLATRPSLLARLKNWEDQESWQEFFDAYHRLIHGVALKSGLSEAEAQDATQDTILAVVQNIRQFKYNPERCAFKSWLMLLTRQRIIWQIRKRLPGHATSADDHNSEEGPALERFADPNVASIEQLWEEEWQKNLIATAFERVKQVVRPRDFQIFDLVVSQGWAPAQVARTLQISTAQVYLLKHRVSRLVKKAVHRLQKQTFD